MCITTPICIKLIISTVHYKGNLIAQYAHSEDENYKLKASLKRQDLQNPLIQSLHLEWW